MMRLAFISVLISSLLFSCGDKTKFNKMAGIYDVYKYELVYYDTLGNVDSTVTKEDIGTLGLAYNDSDTYNNIQRDWDFDPVTWANWGVGGILAVGWYLDVVDGETITFFSEDEYYDYYVLYTIHKKPGKKMEWTTVLTYNTSGNIRLKETIFVKKK
jgi:hypothetical protein